MIPSLFVLSEQRRDKRHDINMAVSSDLISAKGTEKWVHTMGRPLVVDGTTVNIIGTLQDITGLIGLTNSVSGIGVPQAPSRRVKRVADLY